MSTNGPRAEVVGSLLRPDYLKEAVAKHQAGELDDAGLREVQDRAVRERIALQEECGIEVVTDGEMRRTAWTDPLTAGLRGFGRSEQIGLFSQEGPRRSMLPALTGEVALERNMPRRALSFARRHATPPVNPNRPTAR
jgi:methionine synthase II (cobalamin-independent)